VFLTDTGLTPYDVSNDVMKSVILEISNDDIIPINFVFDSICLLSAANEPHSLPPYINSLMIFDYFC